MKSYKELKVWQKSYRLTLNAYTISEKFPKHEIYGITSQFRRAMYSVPANIAEGFNRRTSKEYLNFLYIAKGSLQEASFFSSLSKDLGYLDESIYHEFNREIEEIAKMLSGLIKAIRSRNE